MKTIYKIFLSTILAFLIYGCNRDNPVTPSAQFRLNAPDNTVYAGENFTIFMDAVRGDFVTFFPGDKVNNTYDPANPKVRGTILTEIPDSLPFFYTTGGTFTFTLIASSSGKFGEEFLTDIKSVTITVLDRRTDITKITIDKIDGQLSEDGTEFYFYATRNMDLTAKIPIFFTSSKTSTVYIGDVQQVSGTTAVDFSPLNPSDPEGRPVVYTVKASNGDQRTYTVKYILRDPSDLKVLNYLTFSSLGKTFYPDETSKNVEIVYPADAKINSIKVLANASPGAIVTVGTKQIQGKENTVDFSANNTIVVQAEDGSKQNYGVTLTMIERISTFTFVSSKGVSLNPAPAGIIDYVNKTILVKVLKGTDVKTLAASIGGLTKFSARVGSTPLVNGVTVIDYSNPVLVDLYLGDRKLDSYTVTVQQFEK